MPYIVKSSLDIGGKVVPWNEKEINKLIKEKEEKLNKKEEEKLQPKIEKNTIEEHKDEIENKLEKTEVEVKPKTRKKEKAGEN